jgi:hypothetical protein
MLNCATPRGTIVSDHTDALRLAVSNWCDSEAGDFATGGGEITMMARVPLPLSNGRVMEAIGSWATAGCPIALDSAGSFRLTSDVPRNERRNRWTIITVLRIPGRANRVNPCSGGREFLTTEAPRASKPDPRGQSVDEGNQPS